MSQPRIWDKGTAFESSDEDLSPAHPDTVIWDKGTAFQSPPNRRPEPAPRDDDIIWDKGTAFESRQPRNPQ